MKIGKPLLIGALAMICLLASRGWSASAQDPESSATLEETLSFLHDFIGSNGNVEPTEVNRKEYGYVSETYQFTLVSKCTATITDEVKYEGNKDMGNGISTRVDTFSLSDIDPFELGPWRVKAVQTEHGTSYISPIYLRTTNQKLAISSKHRVNNGPFIELGGTSILSFEISDVSTGENQKRLIRALKHAIKLCGGKTSPF